MLHRQSLFSTGKLAAILLLHSLILPCYGRQSNTISPEKLGDEGLIKTENINDVVFSELSEKATPEHEHVDEAEGQHTPMPVTFEYQNLPRGQQRSAAIHVRVKLPSVEDGPSMQEILEELRREVGREIARLRAEHGNAGREPEAHAEAQPASPRAPLELAADALADQSPPPGNEVPQELRAPVVVDARGAGRGPGVVRAEGNTLLLDEFSEGEGIPASFPDVTTAVEVLPPEWQPEPDEQPETNAVDASIPVEFVLWGQEMYGRNGAGTPLGVRPLGLNLTDVVLGPRYVCGLRGEGMQCQGSNRKILGRYETLEWTPPANQTVIRIAAGAGTACLITSVGRGHCWGANDHGQAGVGRSEVAILRPTALARHAHYPTVKVIHHISVGFRHACALGRLGAGGLTDGHLICWGTNAHGLMHSPLVNKLARIPVMVNSHLDGNWRNVAAGHSVTFAVAWGHIWSWGSNARNELGGNYLEDVDFHHIGFTSMPLALATGHGTTCIVDDMNNVYCWGRNDLGQMGSAKPLEETVLQPVQVHMPHGERMDGVTVGHGHVCAWREGIAVVCWGRNHHGQAGTVKPKQKPENNLEPYFKLPTRIYNADGAYTVQAVGFTTLAGPVRLETDW